ncbi:MAG: FeoB small GTPase domain-containing protein [Planctomycetota bacterium]
MAECASCSSCASSAGLSQMGLDIGRYDYIVALAGNPNTGKSSVFNAITGLKQHTGNWPGKTVARAEGGYRFNDRRYKLVDLPGTYSLLSAAQDEEIARDFILFGRPDCNLMDEARRKGIEVDLRALARDLGVPVVGTVARTGEGLGTLLQTAEDVITGKFTCAPHRVLGDGDFQSAVAELVPLIEEAVPGLPNPRWVAMRLLDGDHHVQRALLSGELDGIADRQQVPAPRVPLTVAVEGGQ